MWYGFVFYTTVAVEVCFPPVKNKAVTMRSADVLYILSTIQPQLEPYRRRELLISWFQHCRAAFISVQTTHSVCCAVLMALKGNGVALCVATSWSDQVCVSESVRSALVSWVILVPVVCWAEDFDIRANVTVSDCFGTSKRCGAFCKTSEKYDLESHFKLHFPHRRVCQ